jgi:hypothetical protein
VPLSQEIWCDKLTEEVKCMIPQMLKLRWLAVAFAVWGHCCAWVPAHAAPQRWRERTASALDRPATPAAPLRYPPISLAVVFSSAVGLPAERWGRRTCGKSEGVEKGEGELKTPEGDEVGWRPFVRGFVCELAQQAMSAHKACTSGSTGCLVCWSVTGV